MTSDRQIEMHWYCSTCHHDNRGRDLNCANCGKPRENEEYLMPSDTRAAPTVTDPDLLRKATAGPNWSCHYCRSSQRRLDGACARCGAPADEGIEEPVNRQETAPPVALNDDEPEPEPVGLMGRIANRIDAIGDRKLLARGVAAAFGIVLLTVTLWWLFVPHEQRVHVASVNWTHTAEIERYKVISDSGWYADGDAFDVRNEGQRIHHYDHRAVGSHLEPYTVQVACGQTCTPIPRSCSESCTPNRNGFASCRTSCTGGGQSCSTKYCSEGRTRSVIDYQDFPIYQSWYSWHAWRWRHQRDAVLSGTTTETRWPGPKDEHLQEGLALGEKEREGPLHSDYTVRYSNGKEQWKTSPSSEAEFRKRTLGSQWRIDTNRMGMVSNERKISDGENW